jgi:hypothetical protein
VTRDEPLPHGEHDFGDMSLGYCLNCGLLYGLEPRPMECPGRFPPGWDDEEDEE